MLQITSIIGLLSAIRESLPAAVALGINVIDAVGAAQRLLSSPPEGTTEEDLTRVAQEIAGLEAEFSARVAELGRLAPRS